MTTLPSSSLKVKLCFLFEFNPAVSEANMVDSCKHFEIGSGSVRSLSHLPVLVIEHLCRDQHETNKIK
jgi:hypothetical protein